MRWAVPLACAVANIRTANKMAFMAIPLKCQLPPAQQCPVRLSAQRALRDRNRANAVQSWCLPLFKRPVSSWVAERVYRAPVSELFRCKVFWLRGLGRKPGQRFAVGGGKLSTCSRLGRALATPNTIAGAPSSLGLVKN